MSPADPGTVRAALDGDIAIITIDAPHRRNAMSLSMYAAVPAAAATAATARVVILRGAGDEAFGAGSDISEFAEQRIGAAAEHYNAVEHAATAAIAALACPVIALIHGPCMGGGVGMALAADIRIAASDASFAVPPGKLGVGYPPEAMRRLAAIVGDGAARELVFTASVIDAPEAHRIGLVNQVVAKTDLDQHVADMARRVARLAPLTLRAAKLSLDSPEQADAAASTCYESQDYRSGIQAFLAKERPTFRGK